MGFNGLGIVKLALLSPFAVVFFSVASVATPLDARIAALTQKISYHDGPNCFNAVSVAQGFTDQITQTSSAELKFYLSLFCRENTGAPQKGDIITTTSQAKGELIHAAIYLEPNLVFEKTSLAGLHGLHNFASDAQYRLIPPDRSYFLNRCSEPKCLRQHYTCEPTPDKVNFLRSCQENEAYKPIAAAKTLQQSLSLDPTENISQDILRSSQTILSLANGMETVDPAHPCALFYLTSWTSITWNLTHSLYEHDGKNPFKGQFPFPLDAPLERLSTAIRPHFQDPQSLWILEAVRGLRY